MTIAGMREATSDRVVELGGIEVHGQLIANDTRCVHQSSPKDILAFKFRCCGRYFACCWCHGEMSDHLRDRWLVAEISEAAVLCGRCETEMSIESYLHSGSSCPTCRAAFNHGYGRHHHFYFSFPSPE